MFGKIYDKIRVYFRSKKDKFMSKDKIISYLSSHKELFLSKYDVTDIGLFGSYARDEARHDSDIDILIEMKGDTTDIHEKKLSLKKMLEDAFGKKVDIARRKYLKPLAKDEIMRELCSA